MSDSWYSWTRGDSRGGAHYRVNFLLRAEVGELLLVVDRPGCREEKLVTYEEKVQVVDKGQPEF